MDLSEVFATTDAQEAGSYFELTDPVRGQATGIKLLIAGPDSKVSKAALLNLERESQRASGRNGAVAGERRDQLMEEFLCKVVLGWEAKEKGKPVPFTEENLLRLIRAGMWVRAQIDGFAGDRTPYFKALKG